MFSHHNQFYLGNKVPSQLIALPEINLDRPKGVSSDCTTRHKSLKIKTPFFKLIILSLFKQAQLNIYRHPAQDFSQIFCAALEAP